MRSRAVSASGVHLLGERSTGRQQAADDRARGEGAVVRDTQLQCAPVVEHGEIHAAASRGAARGVERDFLHGERRSAPGVLADEQRLRLLKIEEERQLVLEHRHRAEPLPELCRGDDELGAHPSEADDEEVRSLRLAVEAEGRVPAEQRVRAALVDAHELERAPARGRAQSCVLLQRPAQLVAVDLHDRRQPPPRGDEAIGLTGDLDVRPVVRPDDDEVVRPAEAGSFELSRPVSGAEAIDAISRIERLYDSVR